MIIYLCTKFQSNTPIQGSGNSEIWIGPADDDDVINELISKVKI